MLEFTKERSVLAAQKENLPAASTASVLSGSLAGGMTSLDVFRGLTIAAMVKSAATIGPQAQQEIAAIVPADLPFVQMRAADDSTAALVADSLFERNPPDGNRGMVKVQPPGSGSSPTSTQGWTLTGL